LQASTRECALELVVCVAASRPKLFRQQPAMLQAVVQVVYAMASEPIVEDQDDEDGGGDIALQV
jgi:hypothetical protein